MRLRAAEKLIFFVQMAGFLRLSPPRLALAFGVKNGGLQLIRQSRTLRFMTQCVEPPLSSATGDDDDEQKKKESKKKRPSPLPPLPDRSEFPDWAYQPRSFFRFEILHQSTKSGARVGRIHTPHGIVDTPSFVAVATNGALKAVDFRDADDAGQQLVFCNTYHLLLHPGSEIIRDAGGIHKFTNRNMPFITDSGGFQVHEIFVSWSSTTALCRHFLALTVHFTSTPILYFRFFLWPMEVSMRSCHPRES